MRNRVVWPALGLLGALVLVVSGVAQPPGRRGGPQDRQGGPGGGLGRGLTSEQIVERLLSFDKNKDGKVSKDELPERMQDLLSKGDTNKDGFLDKDEIKKLSTTLAQDRQRPGAGGRGPGGRGPGGFGPGGGAQRAVDDLSLSGSKKDKAEEVLKGYQESVRKLMDLAHSDLLLKMKGVLSDEEYTKFKAALDRGPGRGPGGPGFGGPGFGGPRPGGPDRTSETDRRRSRSCRRKSRNCGASSMRRNEPAGSQCNDRNAAAGTLRAGALGSPRSAWAVTLFSARKPCSRSPSCRPRSSR